MTTHPIAHAWGQRNGLYVPALGSVTPDDTRLVQCDPAHLDGVFWVPEQASEPDGFWSYSAFWHPVRGIVTECQWVATSKPPPRG